MILRLPRKILLIFLQFRFLINLNPNREFASTRFGLLRNTLMDNNNWRPSIPNREPALDTGDWRNQLPQHLMSQQNSLHQQPLGTQSNVSGLQQPEQQLLSSQVGNSSLQTNQHILSQPTAGLQRTQQAGLGLFLFQGQQSQNQPSQQRMMLLQLHHQQLVLQQQPNLIQQDEQQRLQSSGQVTGSLLPPQNVLDQQRQLYQSQRTLLEMPSSSLESTTQTENANGVDWQEEVYQKIRTMNEKYLEDLQEIYQRASAKLQQQYSLPQQQRSEQFEKLKLFLTMLGRMIRFLLLSKSNIMPALKDKVATYEKHIINFLNRHRPRKPVQQGQLPQPQMQPVQQESSQNGNLAVNRGAWRTQHPPASRQKNVNTLLETLKKHVPYSGEEGIEELMRIAVSFEELIFNTARNQVDYLSKISLKMQSMEEGSEVKEEEFSKRFKTF